ncbi:hypothetical protein PG985_009279 [Apiospora marii]|uniref:Uncharacterized protein n=1 Tax=Apiospora marii TaxID=335849 RepID=A0ABR1RB58_9PEZI
MPLSDESMSLESSSTMIFADDQRDGPWQGQSPCVCYCHQGCNQHNPLRKPIRHNPSLLPKKPRGLSVTEFILRHVAWSRTPAAGYAPVKPTEEDEVELKPVASAGKSPLFMSELPFDTGSITTLQPIHDAIPYHLAFYHLDCARRKLDPKVKLAFISEISCRGTSVIKSTIHRDVPCDWSSEIYFKDGTFLQKQEMMYVIDARQTFWPSTTARACSHQAVRLGRVRIRDNEHLTSVSMRITFLPSGRWYRDKGLGWDSAKGGILNDLLMCGKCRSYLGYHVEVVGRKVHVRFICCRDLGTATQRSLPKWQHILTGDWPYKAWQTQYNWHSPNRRYDQPSYYNTYQMVLQAAKDLNRPDLHLVTYMTDGGEFSPVQV